MKKQTNKTADQYGLEGDGIIENFFHLLWTKDPLFGTSNLPKLSFPFIFTSSFCLCSSYSRHKIQSANVLVLYESWCSQEKDQKEPYY